MDPSFQTQLIGHASYVLLVSAALVRSILPLRLLAIGAGATATWYGIATGSGVNVLWESLFTAVNVVQAALLMRERHAIRLSDEERNLQAAVFPHLSRLDFHRFVRAGRWESLPAGVDLTAHGRPVERIMLLSEGAASVIVEGTVVANCKRGDFIGEIAFVSGSPATATVTTATSTRLLSWRFTDLRALIERQPEIRAALQSVFNQNLIEKLNDQRSRR